MNDEVEGVQNSEPASIRELIEQYIQGRLNEKLEKLKADDTAEREKLFEKYEVETWLEDASLRVQRLRLATHTPKQHHQDSKASAIFYSMAEKTHSYVGSQGVVLEPDPVVDAAVLDVVKLLRKSFKSRTLFSWLLESPEIFSLALSTNQDIAEQRLNRFLMITNSPTELNAGRLSKQVLFPIQDDEYHTLVILYPSSLVHRAYQQLSHDRFSDESKALREARFKKIHHAHESREYPNLLVQNFGGSKPQNISQLNSDRRGSMWLLPSIPPTWKGQQIELPNHGSVFTGYLSNRKDIKPLLHKIVALYRKEDRRNNEEFRTQRDDLVSKLADCIIDMSFELQQSAPSGWTQQSSFSRAESYWLDYGYREELFDKEDAEELTEEEAEWLQAYRERDWHTEVGYNFGTWLNEILTKKGKIVDLDDHEARVWSLILREKLQLLKEEFA